MLGVIRCREDSGFESPVNLVSLSESSRSKKNAYVVVVGVRKGGRITEEILPTGGAIANRFDAEDADFHTKNVANSLDAQNPKGTTSFRHPH